MLIIIERIDKAHYLYGGVPIISDYRLEELVITVLENNYIDGININMKNQTAKVLEKYFYVTHGIHNYVSVINEELEEYKRLPTIDEVNVQTNKIVVIACEFIANACKLEEIPREEFYANFYGLNALLDKIMAVNFADILNQKNIYEDRYEVGAALISSIEEFRNEWNTESEEMSVPIVQDILSIDTSNLSIGMTIKNYKVLCELLGQQVKSGKSRKYQLEDFNRYFEWEKSGQAFVITDIYDTPLTKEDKRRLGNNSIYVQCIEVILLQYLSKQEGYTRTFTKRMWWEMLGITNHKYGRVSENQLKNLDYSVTQFEIKHFYQRCNKKLEQILFSALNSLKNRKLIMYEIQTVIVENDKNGKERYFLASDDDNKNILQVERHVLHNIMGYEKMFQVFLRFQQAEFYKKVSDLLSEYYGWKYYFKQVKVIYTPEDVREALPQMEVILQKELLNKRVIDFLNNNAKEFYDNRLNEYEEKTKNLIAEYIGEAPKTVTRSLWRIPDTYLTAQSILTDELIRIGHRDMIFSAEDFLENNADLDDLFQFDK